MKSHGDPTGTENVTDICYLCGEEITSEHVNSADHAVPRQLIARKQPKAKGFDYGGSLPTHEPCNNRFGPENYCIKALRLITVLSDPQCVWEFGQNRAMGINADCLKEFTEQDLEFFKIIDVRKNSVHDLTMPRFFEGKPRTNIRKEALFVALAVLTKSAAALLVSRYLHEVPSHWRVLAMPYSGATEAADFDEFLGNTKPFDVGVKVWLKPFNSGDWFALYRAYGALVFSLFRFSHDDTIWNGMLDRFQRAQRLSFEGARLNDLINYHWQQV